MTPDEELASLIADRLVENGLIAADRRDEVSAKIAAGTATQEEWQLWIELGPSVQTVGGGDAQD